MGGGRVGGGGGTREGGGKRGVSPTTRPNHQNKQ